MQEQQTTDVEVIVNNEGEVHRGAPGELDLVRRPRYVATLQGDLEAGRLTDRVEHNEEIVERAKDEDAFVADVSVAHWFVQELEQADGKLAEGNDRVTALVTDYSDDAWQVIATQENLGRGGMWFTWAWTFLPKDCATVTRVEGVESPDVALEDFPAREQDW